MSKPFPLLIEVEEIALGSVLRKLNEMQGVAKIHLNLDHGGRKSPASRGLNGGGQRGASEQHVLAMLMEGPKKVAEIAAALGNNKKASNLLHALKKKGLTESKSGLHQLSRKAMAGLQAAGGHSPPPALPAPSKTPSGRAHPGEGPRALLAALQAGAVSRETLKAHLKANGMSAKSIHGVLARSRRDGIIRRNGDQFELTARGIKAAEVAHG